jgi:hypothetical protein
MDSARQRDFSREGSINRQAQGRGSRSFDDAARSARSQPNIGRREYQAARPTDGQVRDFLRMRDGGSRQAQDLRGRAGDAGRGADRTFGRGDSGRSLTGDARDAIRDRDAAGRIGGRAADLTDRTRRDLTGRDRTQRDLTGRSGDRDRGDLTGRIGDQNRGDLQDRIGDANRRGDRDFNRGDRDIARGNRGDRDFGGDRNRDFARRDFDRDREFNRWRDGAWSRDGDRRGDNRDWSGKWRDGDRFDRHHSVRNDWWDDWDHHFDDDDFEWWHIPFVVGWWGHHGFHDHHWGWWDHHHHHHPWYWWSWTYPNHLWTWFDYGWHTPYYWDYGPGEYIYYDDGYVYVNGEQFQPAPVYYENTVELVEQVPTITEEVAVEKEWLPLGVFAVTREGQAEAEVTVQLAITQDGIVGGTAHVQASGQTFPIEGTVEKETQRAVWSYTDDRSQRVIMETSIFNLTQPDATGLVQYSPDNIQVIELVRLEPPEGAGVAADGELPAPPPAQ